MRYGPKDVEVFFTGDRLTHFGGVYLLRQFLRQLDLRTQLSRTIKFPQRNTDYSVSEMILALLYPIILGLGRIETTYLLKTNGVFQWLTGLPTLPHPTTLRRFLKRLYPHGVAQLLKVHDALRRRLVRTARTMVLDLDSTVLTVYGKQESAAVGYNPHKRGRRSYHPLLAFDARTQTSWHGVLRAGDARSATDVGPFFEACVKKKPSQVRRLFVRADAGFYDHKFLDMFKAHKAFYVIVAKHTTRLKRALPHLRFTQASHGWEVAEFQYQPHGWKTPARFVVARYRLPAVAEDDRQLTLFPVTIGRYGYRAYVTNLPFTPRNVWRFYRGRAGIELLIKELKGEMTLAKIPTKFFGANIAYVALLLLAYDVVNAFKKTCLPPRYHRASLRTLRAQLFSIPGQLSRSGHRTTLKLARSFPHQALFLTALKRVPRWH